MKTFVLVRGGYNDDGSYGILFDNDWNPLFVTLEESWRFNKPNISCTPTGVYLVKRASTPHHKETWRLVDVPGRSDILIHVINTEKDTEGCIGLGMEFGKLWAKDDQSKNMEWQPAIRRSSEAIEKFNKMLEGESEFNLIVTGGHI